MEDEITAMDPSSTDTNYQSEEVLRVLDYAVVDLRATRTTNIAAINDARLHLTTFVHHENVIRMFLPFAHAVITFAQVNFKEPKMKDWRVNKRFLDLYGPIWLELLVGV
jgi:hypothetical protein